MKYYYILFLLIFICAKQTHVKQIKNFHVISYKKVDYGYQYSTDIIKWKGNYYSPYLYEEYKKGIILKVGIYKSEGILFYSHADLIKDSLLRNYFSLSIKRNIYLQKNYIIDKGRKYKVSFYQHKYYWNSDKKLKVYIIDNNKTP